MLTATVSSENKGLFSNIKKLHKINTCTTGRRDGE